MNKKLALFVISCVFTSQYTEVSAQHSAYERLREAEGQLEAYKQITANAIKWKKPWDADWGTLKYTPAADGGGTLFIWNGGLRVPYDYNKINYTAWDVEGNRNHPTGSTSITLTATGITIKTYNDVQYYTDFDDETGHPKVPEDPYREYLECRGGKAQRNLIFVIGRTKYTTKASVTCNHQHKAIKVQRGGWNRGHTSYYGGAGGYGNAGNFLSPQKFMHNQTITITYASLAQAAGLTENEFFQKILDEGFYGLICQGFKTEAVSIETTYKIHERIKDHLGPMLTRMAARKCGITADNLRNDFLRQEPSAAIASLEEREAAATELAQYGAGMRVTDDAIMLYTAEEFELLAIYRLQQVAEDYITLYNHLKSTQAPDGITSQVEKKRNSSVSTCQRFFDRPPYHFTKPFKQLSKQLEEALRKEPEKPTEVPAEEPQGLQPQMHKAESENIH